MSTEEMINEELIKLAAKVGAETAIQQMSLSKKNEKEYKKQRTFRNTKLLLDNYRAFKAHSDNAVSSTEQAVSSVEDGNSMQDLINLMWDPNCKSDLIIKSIKESAIRTTILMTHINTMISIYEQMSINSPRLEEQRRYNVLYDRYISEENLSVTDIAQKYYVDIRTVYTDIRIATEKLSQFLFGVDWE